MQNKQEFEQLAGAYGYAPIELKNPAPMWSFLNDDSKVRINYYYSTGSTTAQLPRMEGQLYGKMILNKKGIIDALQFEYALIEIQKKISETL